MRYVCLLVSILVWILLVLFFPATLDAQDGAAIYKERCASCHAAAEGRAPRMDALKAMSGEAIYIALTSGSMKTRGGGRAQSGFKRAAVAFASFGNSF